MKFNKDFILEYVALAKNLGLSDAYLRRMISSGNAQKYDLGILSAGELKKCLCDAISYGKGLGLHISFYEYLFRKFY